jgi:hypothetical protein
MFAIAAGALTAALVFAAYGSLAVRGIRTLERERDLLDALDTGRRTVVARLADLDDQADIADNAVFTSAAKALAAEHDDRLRVLQRQCRHVLAVDPGVRALRASVCDAIALDRQTLSRQALDQANGLDGLLAIGRGDYRADRLLARERKQWRLDPGDPPSVPAFTAGDAFAERLSRMAEEPIGARLLVIRGYTLEIINPDGNTTTATVGSRAEAAAALKDWLAVATDKGIYALDTKDPSRERQIRDGSSGLVPSIDTNTIWVPTDDGFVELDRTGAEMGAPFSPGGEWLIAVSSRYLITSQGDADGFGLWDRQTRRPVQRIDNSRLLAARGDLVVWADGANVVHATNPAFTFDRSIGYVMAAAIDPAGTRIVTIGEGSHNSISVAKQDGTWLTTALTVDGTQLAWSPNGRWVFVGDGTHIAYADGVELRNRQLRLPRESRQLVAAF